MRTHALRSAGLLMILAPALPALAQTPAPIPAITVEGSATTTAVPDMARLTIGVELNRPTASAAAADVAKAAQAMVDQIKAEGIEDKDVTTGSISLSPINPEPGITAARTQRGFRASTELTVTVKPADRAGTVASHLVDKGANTIDGIDYATSQENKLTDDLRAEAMRDARHKADIYVGALGLHLGRVLEITPNGVVGAYPPPPASPRKMSILAGPAPTLPVSPGTLTLQTSVSVRWEILP